ncbi:hypothetical protein ACVWXL_005755 [Bradyrhizobium sp. GM22.5]
MLKDVFKGPPSLVAALEIARKFGRLLAELPIQKDMMQSRNLGVPGPLHIVFDASINSSDESVYGFIITHQGLPPGTRARMINFRDRSGEFKGLPSGSWSRPDAIVHTAIAKEYYEIKPISDPGILGANKKFENLDRFCTTFALPYQRGTLYMSDTDSKEAEITSPAIKALFETLAKTFGLKNIRLFLVWQRPAPGLIVYFVRVQVEGDEERLKNNSAMRDLAQHALRLAIQSVVPEANLVKIPNGEIKVDVPPELGDFRETIRIFAGSSVIDGVPGETHLLVVSDAMFKRIIERQRQLPPLLRSAGPMFKSDEWARAIREFDARQAETRDNLIIGAAIIAASAVAVYVVVGGVATATVATAAGAGGFSAEAISVGPAVARPVLPMMRVALRGMAANDNAVKVIKGGIAAGVFMSFAFGGMRDAEAAEKVVKTAIVTPGDLAIEAGLLLRPNKTFGPGPSEFGSSVELSMFGIIVGPALGGPDLPSKMRLVGRVTFHS